MRLVTPLLIIALAILAGIYLGFWAVSIIIITSCLWYGLDDEFDADPNGSDFKGRDKSERMTLSLVALAMYSGLLTWVTIKDWEEKRDIEEICEEMMRIPNSIYDDGCERIISVIRFGSGE